MKVVFLRRKNAKVVIVSVILSVLFLLVLGGCGNQYSDTFKDRPEAVAMTEEAIECLELCLDGKIGLDRIGDEIIGITEKYAPMLEGDPFAASWCALLSIDGHSLSFYGVDWEIGIESTSSMMNRVEEVKAGLEDSLYK